MIRVFFLSFLLAGVLLAQSSPKFDFNSRIASDAAMSGDERWRLFVLNNFASPGAIFQVAAPAAIQTLANTPKEWQRNSGGFGRRAGLNFLINTSQSGIHSGASALLGYDPRYQRCDCKGAMKRLGHAFSGIVLSANSSGKRGFSPSNLIGAYGSGFIGATIYPDRYSVRVKGMQLGHQQIGGVAFQNLLLEFQPELVRLFRHTILRKP